MKWIEVTPLPEVCKCCLEEDCYNCDNAGLRWQLSRADELQLRRKMLRKAIERLERQVAAVDEELRTIQED